MSGLLFYMHDGPKTFRLELSGSLSGIEVRKLEQAWKTAASTFDGKVLAVDLTFLKETDESGRALLARWADAGAQLIANSELAQKLTESITGRAYEKPGRLVGPTFHAAFTSSMFRTAVAALILSAILMFPVTAMAAGEVAGYVIR